MAAGREGAALSGYAGLPTFNRANSLMQFLFLNGRPLRDPLLAGALRAAYADVLARDRFPIVALFLEMHPSEFDVNVHPAKLEVRFRDPGMIRGLIIGAIREALSENGFRAATSIGAATLGCFSFGRRNADDAPERLATAGRGTVGRCLPHGDLARRSRLDSRCSTGHPPTRAPASRTRR